MASLCLSAAPILRCEAFSRIQNIVLVAPTALEFIFATYLLFNNRSAGWTFLWLTAEGWIYFALALLEMLSHILPAVQGNITLFRNIDTTLAALSSLPLLFYTVFVFSFAREELTSLLPRRFKLAFTALLLFSIPAIVTLNELGSFLGISIRYVPVNGRSLLSIGFPTPGDETKWTFFTSFTLAMLTAFQAVAFSLSFFRLVKVFLDKRRVENYEADEVHFYRGMPWVTAAFKIGAIEAVVGFAERGFAEAMARRILRAIARSLISIGLSKGLDSHEDFSIIRSELDRNSTNRSKRQSRLRALISNPRHSTFQQLSPAAANFHYRLRTEKVSPDGNISGLPTLSEFARYRDSPTPIPRSKQRVTVRYSGGERPPTLHMRFSELDMPSPALIVDSIKSRPVSEFAPSIARTSSYYAPSAVTSSFMVVDPPPVPVPARASEDSSVHPHAQTLSVFSPPLPNPHQPVEEAQEFAIIEDDPPPINNVFAGMHTRDVSQFSTQSYPESMNTIGAVRELASQFPVPGAVRRPSRGGFASWEVPVEDPREYATPSSVGAYSGTQPSPRPRPIDPFAEEEEEEGEVRDSVAEIRERQREMSAELHVTAAISGYTPSASVIRSPETSMVTTPDTGHPFVYDEGQPTAALTTGKSTDLRHSRVSSQHKPWVYEGASVHTPPSQAGTFGEPEGDTDGPAMATLKKSVPLHRIKSMGAAPRRSTPTPTKHGLTRGSIYIEPILIPPKQPGMPEAIQGSYSSSALRDSDVLGSEDFNISHRT